MVLGPGEFSEMIGDIRSGRAMLIEKHQGNTAIHVVRIHRQRGRIFVLSDGKHVLTAWPNQKRLHDIRRRMSAGSQKGEDAPFCPRRCAA